MNTNTAISFPGLGIQIDPKQALELGPLSIHLYGLIIAVGLMLAVIYACKRCRQFGLTADDLTDGVLWIVPLAIVCARLYYCIFEWDSYKENPIEILYIWNGGLAIYGGVIGAALGILLFARLKKVKVGAVLDITSLGFLIGQSIGRWGNFFNREAFGAETDSFLRMGLYKRVLDNGSIINSSTVTYYHPTFLYESLWNAAGFVLLHFLSKKRKYDGQIALGYLAWYGLGRTFIEGLRTDSLYLGQFRVSQLLAAVTCFCGVALLMFFAFRQHDPANLQANIFAAKEAAKAAEETDDESIDEDIDGEDYEA